MAVCQNLVPLVNIKIAGKWTFIPLKMVLIGIDPYPNEPTNDTNGLAHGHCFDLVPRIECPSLTPKLSIEFIEEAMSAFAGRDSCIYTDHFGVYFSNCYGLFNHPYVFCQRIQS